jgi:hypothetical protein
MEIETSSLWDQVLSVVNSDQKPIHRYWEADIHANGKTITAFKVLNIDTVRDYENDYAPVLMLDVMIPMGEYTYLVYPFQDKLEITLYGTPLKETGQQEDEGQDHSAERYTATLIDKGNPMMANNGKNTPTQEILDLTNIATVTFQLMNKTVEQMRTMSVGNNFRDETVENAIKSVLTVESMKVKVDSEFKPKGVEMVEASNKAVKRQIAIPHGLPLVDVPNYIHLRQGGVYSAGMGYFYEKDYWYVYPCYDTTRFTKSERTLTVINVPSNKLPQVERTYLQKGSSLIVLATGDSKFSDDSTTKQLTHGNGVMFSDASKFMTDLGTTQGNKLVASRGALLNQFVGTQRDNGVNYVPLAKDHITANPFEQYSQIARREGSVYGFVWDNSDATLLFPGMPVKVLYLEEEDVKEIYGVILKVHEYTELFGQGFSSTRHMTRTMVSVFTQRIVEDAATS